MKPVLFLLLCCGLVVFYSTGNDEADLLFGASDELHGIRMFKQDQRFELKYNGFNTEYGSYELHGDTIFLNYSSSKQKGFEPNAMLARKILIDKKCNRVMGMDGPY